MALGASHQASHVARKLMDGVFKSEALITCTITGNAPRTKPRTEAKIFPLHETARDAIIGMIFSN